MERGPQGRYLSISSSGEKVEAFIPNPLPPSPPLVWSDELKEKYDQALLLLGRLDAVSILLPSTSLFLYMYVRKEAVLSSEIEGTQSSLADLLLFEVDQKPGVPLDDVREVSNYVAAMELGLGRLAEGFPLCLRLIKEMHEQLLAKGRGEQQTPGEFRRSQNWIGGTRPGNAFFVPPPSENVTECMGDLELFLHHQKMSVLVRAALAHVQFETIHPFLDGNGRLGRLLITLLLCDGKLLQQPLLYLSLYFKTHRQHYYDLLNHVRLHGDWERWLDFFVDAVIETAQQAIETAQKLHKLSTSDQALIREGSSTMEVYWALLEHPIATSSWLVEQTGLTPATVNKQLVKLEKLGIIKELTAKKRNRLFCYTKYVDILS
ncbi:MAG: Protein adenylyltransferase SoFic [Chlamydiales bacterium]|nr:Protein adenylyltransferase SoFic [Chlamydiales bacterium]